MLLCILLLTVSCASAKRYLISAPNVFHVGIPENVSVTVFGINSPITVRLFLQDYPHRRKTFSPVQAVFNPDIPQFLTVKVDPKDIPDQASLDKQYVYLVAKSDDQTLQFNKETKILLSFKDGVILIQTDKPIYTPKQSVKIRIIPLGFDLMPTTKKITVVVKNPQGIRVQQWKNLDTTTGFISKVLDLGDFVLKGNWTVEAFYGHLFIHNTSIKFEVREYVLPTFSVEIKGPSVILPTDKSFSLGITSRYTYLKPVQGNLAVRVKIAGMKQEPILLSSFRMPFRNGFASVTIKRSHIMDLPGNIWFPEGSRLQVEADVKESSTGITEHAVENSIVFSSSKYRIKFYKTAQYFKPGLPFSVKAIVTFPDNKPAPNVDVKISAKGTKKDKSVTAVGRHAGDVKNEANRDRTGADGQAEFVIDIPRDVVSLTVKVETAVLDIPPNQNAVKELVTGVYTSTSGEYLMLRQTKPVNVGKTVFCDAFLSSGKVNRLSYMVISRGQIVLHNVMVKKFGITATISFQVTRMMSPSARLVAYYISDQEVIADSILLDIHDTLPNQIQIKEHDRVVNSHPALEYTVTVLGSKGTRVGILGVDQSVYLLRNDNRLTAKSVYEKLENLDLGCGVGGGKNTRGVFKNAGVAVISESFTSTERQDFTCESPLPRRKRSAVQNSEVGTFCCKMGNTTDENNRTCIRRKNDLDIPEFKDKQQLHECKKHFITCCVRRFGIKDMGFLARSGLDFGDLADFGPSDEELIEMTQVRSYFPETWIYEEKVIGEENNDPDCDEYLEKGKCGRALLHATLPDTITNWVVQAVAVSNTSGFGIAKPLNIKTFKPFFLRFTMPYSAQLGEQISILATVYNYEKIDIGVNFHLFGDDGFCSAAPSGERIKLNTKPLRVKAGGSLAFPIAIVPIKYGMIPIKVAVMTPTTIQVDIVEKKLLVVPEGVEERKTQSYVLDPQGVLKDKKQDAERFQDLNNVKNSSFDSQRSFDKSKNTQFDNILIDVPDQHIPESVGAMIYFTGNMIGPVVTNLITGGLEKLLRMPTGCGEQTMIYLSPNVYVLQYLSNTRQVTASVEAKAYKFIQSGYQRELNYRRDDQSFSAFGQSRPGSTWLTAFVLKVFCQASKFDGVQIDQNLICQSVQWLTRNQRADGAFPEVAAVIHKEMVGGVYQSDVAMTAFVVTSLMECRCNGLLNTAAISRAVAFLEGSVANINKPYPLALTTYALAMASSPERIRSNEKLAQLAVYNQATSSRHWNAGGRALNIETAAYALLAQVRMNRLKYAGPIVIWLTEQRNSGGGFQSTTDTCVALQSLAMYSEHTAGSKLDLKITVRSELGRKNNRNAKLFKQLRITKNNALLQQSVDIFEYLGGQFYVDTVGTGVAEMQVDVRYNVPSTRKDRCDFLVSATVSEDGSGKTLSELPLNDARAVRRGKKDKGGQVKRKNRNNRKRNNRKRNNRKRNNRKKNKKRKDKDKKNKNKSKKNKNKLKQQAHKAKKLIIRVCAQYKKPGKTGMSIMDIGIFTGYVVNETSVKEMMLKNNRTIAKYELSQRSVVFYVDEIDSAKQICVAFSISRIVDIGTVYPVPIKVYDYYEPDEACIKFYSSEKTSLSMGSCEGASCKCTQDKCTAPNPSIANLNKLVRKACASYDYAVKVKVLLVDEVNAWLTYDVVILKVIKRGNTKLEVQKVIELKKRGMCISPKLKKNDVLLVMGRDKSGRYILDNSAFVKKWRRDVSQKLDEFANSLQDNC